MVVVFHSVVVFDRFLLVFSFQLFLFFYLISLLLTLSHSMVCVFVSMGSLVFGTHRTMKKETTHTEKNIVLLILVAVVVDVRLLCYFVRVHAPQKAMSAQTRTFSLSLHFYESSRSNEEWMKRNQ